ncbi:hypothetical protein [Pedobacter jeongneungensis]|uniref:hypothetical protein n=1 Tax=Pedobacter jeongneungensis TaxID=947309 RepID=UPI0004680383|nr:hypothetical protein [Pedobacter jeongneungensis]
MKRKIYLSVTDSDIDQLKTFLPALKSENLNSLFNLLIEKENVDEYIRHYTYLALSDMSGFEPNDFKDNSDLKFDLGLSLYQKRALKNYFQKVTNDLGSQKNITVKECEDLKKVIDCLKLIKSKL